jgi:hypothetical protein
MSAYRTINLEDGRPTVSDATRHLVSSVRIARKTGVRLIKFVHGYGSSGSGGKIRPAARRELDKLVKLGYIKYYIPGEKLSIFDENTRRAMDYCGELRRDADLERHNNGVTVAVL